MRVILAERASRVTGLHPRFRRRADDKQEYHWGARSGRVLVAGRRPEVRHVGTSFIAAVMLIGGSGQAAYAQSQPGKAQAIWSGTWVRTEPAPGKGALTLTVSEGGVGTIRLTGSACLSADTNAKITVEGSNLRVDARDSDVTARFVGKTSGNTISGTMTVSCHGQVGKGSWQAKKS